MARKRRKKKGACKLGRVKSGARKGRCKKHRAHRKRSRRASGLHRRGRKASWKCQATGSKDTAERFAGMFSKRGKTASAVKVGGAWKVCHT